MQPSTIDPSFHGQNLTVNSVRVFVSDTLFPRMLSLQRHSQQAALTAASPVRFNATFSEPVFGVTAALFSTGGSSAGIGAVSVSFSAGGLGCIVTVNATSTGTVLLSVAAAGSGVVDAAGNALQSSALTASVNFGEACVVTGVTCLPAQRSACAVRADITPPVPVITLAPGQADPTNSNPVAFRATFSEPCLGLLPTAVQLSAGTTGASSVQLGGTSLLADILIGGMNASAGVAGTIAVSLPAGVCWDAAGNANLASVNAHNSLYFDEAVFGVSINQPATQPDPTNSAPVEFLATFSKVPAGFVAADVSTAGSTAGGPLSVQLVNVTSKVFSCWRALQGVCSHCALFGQLGRVTA